VPGGEWLPNLILRNSVQQAIVEKDDRRPCATRLVVDLGTTDIQVTTRPLVWAGTISLRRENALAKQASRTQ